jgi:hypothetical protein
MFVSPFSAILFSSCEFAAKFLFPTFLVTFNGCYLASQSLKDFLLAKNALERFLCHERCWLIMKQLACFGNANQLNRRFIVRGRLSLGTIHDHLLEIFGKRLQIILKTGRFQ